MREVIGNSVACNHHKVGIVGLLVTLGIVFGDIGTSPLYVMKAILHTGVDLTRLPQYGVRQLVAHCRV